jgi:hypothetical protein
MFRMVKLRDLTPPHRCEKPALKNTIYKQFKTVLNSLYTICVYFARVHKRKLNGWSLSGYPLTSVNFGLTARHLNILRHDSEGLWMGGLPCQRNR